MKSSDKDQACSDVGQALLRVLCGCKSRSKKKCTCRKIECNRWPDADLGESADLGERNLRYNISACV